MNDNGNQPAFPTEIAMDKDNPFDGSHQTGNTTALFHGLTKREYISAIVLQGMAASQYWAENFTENEADLLKATRVAVKAADPIITQLNKQP